MRLHIGRGDQVTEVVFPSGHTVADAVRDVTAPGGVWDAHGDGETPKWVTSDNRKLLALIASHYHCEIREKGQ